MGKNIRESVLTKLSQRHVTIDSASIIKNTFSDVNLSKLDFEDVHETYKPMFHTEDYSKNRTSVAIGSSKPIESKFDTILQVLKKKKEGTNEKASFKTKFRSRHDSINNSIINIGVNVTTGTHDEYEDSRATLPEIRRLLPKDCEKINESWVYGDRANLPTHDLNRSLNSYLNKGASNSILPHSKRLPIFNNHTIGLHQKSFSHNPSRETLKFQKKSLKRRKSNIFFEDSSGGKFCKLKSLDTSPLIKINNMKRVKKKGLIPKFRLKKPLRYHAVRVKKQERYK
ncbi:unnamed protein product [Moneuplotes crassus]|uniref:Uncharacterized protein n=1 Tax=Euplotes crassus TaxID=5936 RepID=A0AAD1XJV4_EUPCR|nr:unnamed protein product [Moneuplotes crassus]